MLLTGRAIFSTEHDHVQRAVCRTQTHADELPRLCRADIQLPLNLPCLLLDPQMES